MTVLVGIFAFFGNQLQITTSGELADASSVMIDLPDTAAFLTPRERAYVIHKKGMFHLAMVFVRANYYAQPTTRCLSVKKYISKCAM